ncbi:MAG TPA: hypothetical protein VHJ20_14935 [Polyangia bacterium]|nr:hypothetical protein [Polyangia bacterium]
MASPFPWLQNVEEALTRHERALTLAIIGAVMVLQLNGILHHGFMGQDWGIHPGAAADAIRLPPFRWFVYVGTNPPALYWLSALVNWMTGTTAYIQATSFVLVALNLIALRVWSRIAPSIIHNTSLRLAALVTIAFLPVRVIHSTVFATDALIVLPFAALIWVMCELVREPSPSRQLRLVVAASVALMLGIFSKYTMVSALFVIVVLLVAWRKQVPGARARVAALTFLVVVPGVFAAVQYHYYVKADPNGPGRQRWQHQMTWRSLLTLRSADRDVLRAPLYDDKVAGDPVKLINNIEVTNLLIDNKHSYPALLHLSTFTDVLNVYQYDPSDNYLGARDPLHQRLMTIAVRTSVPLSLLMVIATFVYLARMARQLVGFGSAPRPDDRAKAIVVAISAAAFANITLALPSVQHPYFFGYWLARLVLPSLLGFCFLAFALLDEKLRSSGARLTVLAAAVAQAALHASFLWPRGP